MWAHDAQAEAAQEAKVADQPGTCGLVFGHGAEQCVDVVVITQPLVAEARSVRQNADRAGVPALDDMRELPVRAIGPGHNRNRAKRRGPGQVAAHLRADGLRHGNAIAGGLGHGKRLVLGVAGEDAGAQRGVIGIDSGGQHDTTGAAQAGAVCHPYAGDPPALLQQPRDLRTGAQLDAEIECRAHEPGDQCIAVAQVHAPPVEGKVADVAQHAVGGVQEGLGRAGHGHEGAQVGSGLDGHAEESRFAHRLAQQLHRRTEAPPVEGFRDDRAPTGARARQMAIGAGIAVPGSKATAVRVSKKSTNSGAAPRKASTRSGSK